MATEPYRLRFIQVGVDIAAHLSSETMMLRRALIIAAALAELVSAGQAHSAGSGNEFLAHLLGRLHRQGESFAYFSRQYDDAQLAARPSQRVTFVKALVDAYFRESSFVGARGAYSYQVSLAFKFRDRTETLTGVAECGDGTQRFAPRRRVLRRPGVRGHSSRSAGTSRSFDDHSRRRRPLGAGTGGPTP